MCSLHRMNDFIDQPGTEPSTSFDETLQLIERISVITGNAKQITALTGWQNKGMFSFCFGAAGAVLM